MSADFWAGYISGAVGIIIGNPLDVLKVKLQASTSTTSAPLQQQPTLPHPTTSAAPNVATVSGGAASSYFRPWIKGTAAPVLGYGALNALLFVSYNRTESALNTAFGLPPGSPTGSNLWSTWIAGAVGGLATWVVSTPTELVKCRAQLAATPTPSGSSSSSTSGIGRTSATATSWGITKQVLRTEGIKGLYFGGVVTALRDSIGYGFYFWSYELSSRWVQEAYPPPSSSTEKPGGGGGGLLGPEAAKVLLCGGLAGIVTWASIFPLDVIKTRVQTQGLSSLGGSGETEPLLSRGDTTASTQKHVRKLGAWDVAKETYREGGIKPFFRGLAVCSVRAFIVNAVQWAVYEWIMMELGQGRRAGAAAAAGGNGEVREMSSMGAA